MIKVLAVSALLLTTLNAQAVDVTPPASPTSSAAALNSLAPSSGTSAKADYANMTRAEKLKHINDKHAASVKKSELRWKSLSDDEKIAKFEKRRNSFMARRNAKAQQNAAVAANATAPAAGTPTHVPAHTLPNVVPSPKITADVNVK